jgi:diguanylate cyclase (GGDEF)-like protein/PAS domain S-box-containing protein
MNALSINPARSLATQLLLPLLLAGTLAAIVGGVALYQQHLETARTDLANHAERLARTLILAAEANPQAEPLERFTTVLGAEARIRRVIVVHGEPLRVLAAHRVAWRGLTLSELPLEAAPRLLAEAAGGVEPKVAYEDHNDYVDVALPLHLTRLMGMDNGQIPRGAALLTYDAGPALEHARGEARNFAMGFGIAVLLLVTLGYGVISWRVLGPLYAIGRAIDQRGDSAPDLSASLARRDEIGHLSRILERLSAAERREWEQRHFLDTLIETIPNPIFYKDAEGRYQGCNHAFLELIGMERGSLIGRTVDEIWPPDLARAYREADGQILAQGGHQRYEAQVESGNGERRDVLFDKAVLTSKEGEPLGLIGTLTDITERKALEANLAHEASHDSLTGLFNRSHVERAALHTANEVDRYGGHLGGLLFDLDHFKQVNDNYGHAAGDEVLRRLAQLLHHRLREADIVGRWGGEEFLVILPQTDLKGARQVAEDLRHALEMEEMPEVGRVTMSVGCSEYRPGEGTDPFIKRLDDALYAAKDAGRNQVRCLAPGEEG